MYIVRYIKSYINYHNFRAVRFLLQRYENLQKSQKIAIFSEIFKDLSVQITGLDGFKFLLGLLFTL